VKYAWWPGCVARGATPELYTSTVAVLKRLEIEVEEMHDFSCTGAGVLQERNRKLGDTLNVRNFAIAERLGLPIMTICSTCQGVMAQAHQRVMRDPGYLAEINGIIAEEGLTYRGTTVIKHLLWILVEELGVEELKKRFTRDLSCLSVAPFYGCYLLRPSDALGYDRVPARETALDRVIEATGARLIDFEGKRKCCGFPILLINQDNSLKMVANHTGAAKDGGADAMVTPCPLCHLNLDGYQDKAARKNRPDGRKVDLPIIHFPQLIGLAMGIEPHELGFRKHMVSTRDMLARLREQAAAIR
jgi:succinate dehydrogenase / fumarate reductase cytochrome b subunit